MTASESSAFEPKFTKIMTEDETLNSISPCALWGALRSGSISARLKMVSMILGPWRTGAWNIPDMRTKLLLL